MSIQILIACIGYQWEYHSHTLIRRNAIMSYGYGAGAGGGFALIVVLFILLIIIGASFGGYGGY
ncbi:hypothetical protein GCM10028868_25930 [Virgibacillus kimchii]